MLTIKNSPVEMYDPKTGVITMQLPTRETPANATNEDPVSQLFKMAARRGLTVDTNHRGDSLNWVIAVEVAREHFEAAGPTKKAAKRAAVSEALNGRWNAQEVSTVIMIKL